MAGCKVLLLPYNYVRGLLKRWFLNNLTLIPIWHFQLGAKGFYRPLRECVEQLAEKCLIKIISKEKGCGWWKGKVHRLLIFGLLALVYNVGLCQRFGLGYKIVNI